MHSERKAEVGDRVAVTRDIDLQPYATIPRGEAGTVVRVDSDGNVDIELDHAYPGLAQFQNCVWVCNHEGTDEVRDAMMLMKKMEPKERACRILLQSYLPRQALHSTVSATLLFLLSAISS